MTLKNKMWTRSKTQDPAKWKWRRKREKKNNAKRKKLMVDEENAINKHVKRECRSSFHAFKYQIVGFLLLLFGAIWIPIPWVVCCVCILGSYSPNNLVLLLFARIYSFIVWAIMNGWWRHECWGNEYDNK